MSLSGNFTGIGVAPSVVSATMKNNVVKVTFSEEMDPATLTISNHYSIPGVTVVQVQIDPSSNNSAVFLTLTGYNPSTTYTVTVSNITDKAGNPVA